MEPKKPQQTEGENLAENQVKKKNKFDRFLRLFLAVIILLLALSILIGHIFANLFNLPLIIAIFIVLYFVVVAFLLLWCKKEIVTIINLIVLIILIVLWCINLCFLVFIAIILQGEIYEWLFCIANLVLSPTAIIAIFIYLMKTKEGEKNNEN